MSQLPSSQPWQQQSAPPPPSSKAQQRPSKQKVQFSPASSVSPAPSPPPPATPPHLRLQPPMSQSTHSLSGRTAVSSRTALSDRTAVDPEPRCSFLSTKFPQSMWQGWRRAISSPRRPNEASGPQQNPSQRIHSYSLPLCDYKLKIEWN